MIATKFAQEFAKQWVASWNSHDLDRVMSHYTDDFEITSPFIATLMQEPTGMIKGKENVRAYWAKALKRIPDLTFGLIDILISVDSITIYYNAILGKRAAEVLFFDGNHKVKRSIAHYHLEK